MTELWLAVRGFRRTPGQFAAIITILGLAIGVTAAMARVTFAIRTAGSLPSLLPALRRTIGAVDPELLLWQAETMDELLAAPMAQPRTSALLMSWFGLAALLLSAVGLYAVLSTLVRERTREIGIRMALGASAGRVRREVFRRTLVIFSVGAGTGLVAAVAFSRSLAGLLFGVKPAEPVVILTAVALLWGVSLVATSGPARRATGIDPADALRAD